jgi:hypothetical protein
LRPTLIRVWIETDAVMAAQSVPSKSLLGDRPNGLLSPGGGTRLYESTLGVNGYPNDHTRLMADYTTAPRRDGGLESARPVFGVRPAILF